MTLPSYTGASYNAWHELRYFVTHTTLNLERAPGGGHLLHSFPDGCRLTSDVKPLPKSLQTFVENACEFIQSNDRNIQWSTSTGPSLEGSGLERQIIANELRNRHGIGYHPDTWSKDIVSILSFLSQTSQRRYEKAPPQLTIEYDPNGATGATYGVLGKPLLDEYRALLRLCRDAHTILCVKRGLLIVDIESGCKPVTETTTTPVAPRLAHLQVRSREKKSIVFNLNANGSQEIMCMGETVFRQVDGVWHFLALKEALESLVSRLVPPLDEATHQQVARNALMLALDLADHGEGALLFLCEEPTTEVLQSLFLEEGLIREIPGMPFQELTVRMRFTQLVGLRTLSLGQERYADILPLLRDICGIDGCTIFSHTGELLGFGCIVKERRSPAQIVAEIKRTGGGRVPSGDQGSARPEEGARAAATRIVSQKETGVAIKVSSDGTASLFMEGKAWGILW